jgi:hypothetical protein
MAWDGSERGANAVDIDLRLQCFLIAPGHQRAIWKLVESFEEIDHFGIELRTSIRPGPGVIAGSVPALPEKLWNTYRSADISPNPRNDKAPNNQGFVV